MTQRHLDIKVAYAEDLKNVNLFSKMDVYVVVSIIGGTTSSLKQKTNIDRDSGTHPTWNFPMRFTIDEVCALQGRLSLFFKLKCEGSLTDSNLGEVRVPIVDLLSASSPTNPGKYVHYQVTNSSGKGQGMLSFSYKFSEKIYGSQPADRVVETIQPLKSNPYPYPYPHPFSNLHGQVPESRYTYQPPPMQYPDPYPCPSPYPTEQATGSLYNYVIPYTSPGYDYAYSSYEQRLEVYPPPPPQGGYLYPPRPQSTSPYPPQRQSASPYPPHPILVICTHLKHTTWDMGIDRTSLMAWNISASS